MRGTSTLDALGGDLRDVAFHRKSSAGVGSSLRYVACAGASTGIAMGRGAADMSRRGLALEMSACLDDVDFGVSSSKAGRSAWLSGKAEVQRSEVKSDRKRWNGEKAVKAVSGGRASETLASRLDANAPIVAKIVTRAQHAKDARNGGGAATSKRTRGAERG